MKGIPSTPEQRAEILRLAPAHTPKAIAEAVGLNLGNVYRILSDAGVSAVRAENTHRPTREQAQAAVAVRWQKQAGQRHDAALLERMRADAPRHEPKAPQPKVNPLKFAGAMYGTRLTERGGAFHLDGVPIRYSDLMRRVNADFAKQGLPQPLTACPDWLA